MKIVKNLLPIALIGSAAAVITPTVASCGSTSMFNAMDEVDTTGWETFNGEQEITEEDALKYYGEACSKDISIFTKDVIWGRYTYVNNVLQKNTAFIPAVDIKKANHTISNVDYMNEFGTPLFSFTTKVDIDIVYQSSENMKTSIQANYTFSINHFPINILNGSDPDTGIVPVVSILPIQGGASAVSSFYATHNDSFYHLNGAVHKELIDIETEEKISSTDKKIELMQDKDNLNTNISEQMDLIQICVYCWPSYYFNDIQLTK